jgi:transcriptional regulator of arginine metabolism
MRPWTDDPIREGEHMRKRDLRQDAIRHIVRSKVVRTQRDLVVALHDDGFTCTQATVSRDIADMGVVKLPEGVYVLSEDVHLQRMVSELVDEVVRAENLVLVKASAGAAPGVAAALDAADLDGVLGSIAGDDTILMITADGRAGEALVERLDRYR